MIINSYCNVDVLIGDVSFYLSNHAGPESVAKQHFWKLLWKKLSFRGNLLLVHVIAAERTLRPQYTFKSLLSSFKICKLIVIKRNYNRYMLCNLNCFSLSLIQLKRLWDKITCYERNLETDLLFLLSFYQQRRSPHHIIIIIINNLFL